MVLHVEFYEPLMMKSHPAKKTVFWTALAPPRVLTKNHNENPFSIIISKSRHLTYDSVYNHHSQIITHLQHG